MRTYIGYYHAKAFGARGYYKEESFEDVDRFHKFESDYKAAATRKNRYAQDFRIYSTAEAFLSDFGDDEQAINCANHFKENCNGKDRTTCRRQIL